MRVRKKKHGAERMEACADLWIKEPERLRGKWREAFGNENPVHVEIGCGKGDFVTGMAAAHPDINFVAVEMVADVIVTAMEKAKAAGLKNVLFANFNAEKITDVFGEGEAARIYLNFSDPWKKNRQAKRRLTHKNFLGRYKRVLENGGCIWFKTDNRQLFEFSLNSFAAEDFKLGNVTLDLHNSGFEGNVMTEYEKRFSDLGQPIYRLEARYTAPAGGAAPGAEESPAVGPRGRKRGGLTEFQQKVYDAVERIPRGKVASYAEVARAAGSPRASRAVGNILHNNPFFGVVPCHRVVHADGSPAAAFAFGGEGVQRRLLENEGVTFTIDGRVNMRLHGCFIEDK